MRNGALVAVLLVAAACVAVTHVLAGRTLARAFGRRRLSAGFTVGLCVAGAISLLAAHRAGVSAPWSRRLGLMGAAVFTATLGAGAVAAAAHPLYAWWRRKRQRVRPAAAAEAPTGQAPATEPVRIDEERMGRRDLLERGVAGSAVLLGAGPGAFGVLHQRTDFEPTTQVFALPMLDPALEGFSIVQLSDLHFGAYVTDAEASDGLALVRRLRPDAIVLTGDLVDHSLAPLPELGRFVRRLRALARFGVFVVPGNHDVWTNVDAVLEATSRAGATVLVNAHRVIGGPRGFTLAGVDDLWNDAGGPDLAAALVGADPARATVLLCHNPEFFPEAAPRVDLQLSGHTHGGQVSVAGTNVASAFGYERVAGRYRLGASQLYVNRGFGTYGLPIRFGVRPEITRIVLTRRG